MNCLIDGRRPLAYLMAPFLTSPYKGYHAERMATGVSRATTEAVVLSSVLILAWDYFPDLDSLMARAVGWVPFGGGPPIRPGAGSNTKLAT
jgi:permease MlaE